MVERFHAQVIIGPLATFEALAIDDYVRQSHVTETKPGVSQFWTYAPKQFLSEPVYSATIRGPRISSDPRRPALKDRLPSPDTAFGSLSRSPVILF